MHLHLTYILSILPNPTHPSSDNPPDLTNPTHPKNPIQEKASPPSTRGLAHINKSTLSYLIKIFRAAIPSGRSHSRKNNPFGRFSNGNS